MNQAAHFLPLAPVAFEVLLSLLPGAQHGYALIRDIRERTSGDIDLPTSTLYSTLRRLEDGGLVAAGEAPVEPSAGPPRRYFRITPLGRAVVELETARLQRAASYARRQLREGPA